MENRPIYHHWFSLAVYEAYLSATKQLGPIYTTISLKIGSSTRTITRSKLEYVVKATRFAASLPTCPETPGFGILSSSAICSQELTFSSLCARALDRFFFDDESEGACLHQGPVRKRAGVQGPPEACDVYVTQFRNFKPGTPVMVLDMKLQDFDTALKETGLYATCVLMCDAILSHAH